MRYVQHSVKRKPPCIFNLVRELIESNLAQKTCTLIMLVKVLLVIKKDKNNKMKIDGKMYSANKCELPQKQHVGFVSVTISD